MSDWRAQRMPSCSAAFRRQPLQFELAHIQPFADARHLGIELLQHVPRCHSLQFSLALFAIEAIQQGTELFDLAAKC